MSSDRLRESLLSALTHCSPHGLLLGRLHEVTIAFLGRKVFQVFDVSSIPRSPSQPKVHLHHCAHRPSRGYLHGFWPYHVSPDLQFCFRSLSGSLYQPVILGILLDCKTRGSCSRSASYWSGIGVSSDHGHLGLGVPVQLSVVK